MNIYGARYPKKEKMKKILNEYENLKEKQKKKLKLPKNFPKCFENDNLIQAINSALFSLKNGRHVLLVGEEGSGLTQVARWSAEAFSNKSPHSPYLCICSKKLQCEDLIGITVPNFTNKLDDTSASGTDNNSIKNEEKYNNEILKFKEGFLVKAIKRGKCVIFDQINEAPSTVYERLNGLLDKKYDDEDNKFSVPEYSEKTNFRINKNFRIICTCNNTKLKNISSAFLSRFDIVYLEDQLENVLDYKDLTDKLLQRFKDLEI
jgi:midasin (ATPase involved in ribosome maturation)